MRSPRRLSERVCVQPKRSLPAGAIQPAGEARVIAPRLIEDEGRTGPRTADEEKVRTAKCTGCNAKSHTAHLRIPGTYFQVRPVRYARPAIRGAQNCDAHRRFNVVRFGRVTNPYIPIKSF